MHCNSIIRDFSHVQCVYGLGFMTSLPCVKTWLGVMFWKLFQYCYHIALSVFMEFKIRFLEGNFFSFRDVESHIRPDQWFIMNVPAFVSLIVCG